MKDKKVVLIVVLVVILFLLSLVAIILSNNNQNNLGNVGTTSKPNTGSTDNDTDNDDEIINYDYYLIVEDTDMWAYDNNEWLDLKEFNDNNDKFNVYINNIYYGNYYMKFIKRWNLLDDTKSFVNYSGNILATKGLNVNIKPFNKVTVSELDKTEIVNIIGNDYNNLTINEKLYIDLDYNGITDKIVNISNIDSENEEIYFNLVYVEYNGNINILIKDIIDERELLIKPRYDLEYVLNINNSDIDNIILEERYLSTSGKDSRIMYQYINDSYKLIIGNESN